MNYCTLEQLIGNPQMTGYLPDVSTDEDKAKLLGIIERSSRRIDLYVTSGETENYFQPAPTTPTTKRLRGFGYSFLELPRHVRGSVTTITAPVPFLVPAFAVEDNSLICVDALGVRSRFAVWTNGVPFDVTARWGFAETPQPIVEACLQIAVRTYRGADESFSGVIGNVNTDGSIVERALPAPVKEILEGYRRQYSKRTATFA